MTQNGFSNKSDGLDLKVERLKRGKKKREIDINDCT